jgi:hypothetical protein
VVILEVVINHVANDGDYDEGKSGSYWKISSFSGITKSSFTALINVRLEIVTMIKIHIVVFWVMTYMDCTPSYTPCQYLYPLPSAIHFSL